MITENFRARKIFLLRQNKIMQKLILWRTLVEPVCAKGSDVEPCVGKPACCVAKSRLSIHGSLLPSVVGLSGSAGSPATDGARSCAGVIGIDGSGRNWPDAPSTTSRGPTICPRNVPGERVAFRRRANAFCCFRCTPEVQSLLQSRTRVVLPSVNAFLPK